MNKYLGKKRLILLLVKQYGANFKSYKIKWVNVVNVVAIALDEIIKDLFAGQTIRIKNFMRMSLFKQKPKLYFYKFYNEWRKKERDSALKIFFHYGIKKKIYKLLKIDNSRPSD